MLAEGCEHLQLQATLAEEFKMPDLNQELESYQLTTNNFGFSGQRIDALDATEYTLVTLVIDTSSSTSPFRDDIRKTVDKVFEACKKSPRADNLLMRVCEFSSVFNEVHGFKKLSTIQVGDYNNEFKGGGMTALNDATENAISATETYGKNLTDNDYQVNAIVFILTDGVENASKATVNSVNEAFKSAIRSEALESLISILIGVQINSQTDQYLKDFKDGAGITQYVNMGDATPGNLAKFAEFVSKSISSQSQSLGSGGPSQALVF